MADKQEIILTAEQQVQFSEIETLVLSALSAKCVGCSTANFAPRRMAGAVVNGNLSREGAVAIAAKFSSCPGLSEICHYSSGAPNETDGQPEIV